MCCARSLTLTTSPTQCCHSLLCQQVSAAPSIGLCSGGRVLHRGCLKQSTPAHVPVPRRSMQQKRQLTQPSRTDAYHNCGETSQLSLHYAGHMKMTCRTLRCLTQDYHLKHYMMPNHSTQVQPHSNRVISHGAYSSLQRPQVTALLQCKSVQSPCYCTNQHVWFLRLRGPRMLFACLHLHAAACSSCTGVAA
jgi:hypothetical protein